MRKGGGATCRVGSAVDIAVVRAEEGRETRGRRGGSATDGEEGGGSVRERSSGCGGVEVGCLCRQGGGKNGGEGWG